MQKAEVVLTMLSQKSTQDSEYVFDRLYRNLFNPDFYMLAYSNIYTRAGAMTQGVDGKTLDGFNTEWVSELISGLKRETYYPNPLRRVYIPQKNGKTRSSGIPAVRDKLVQEVIRMLLEAIYEPVFKDSSHGFRPHRSCHTALTQVKTTNKGTNWVIEGDIKGFFDHIDHAVLLKVLSKKIGDGRFLNLIRKFLTSGYMEFRQATAALTGIPQGAIVSPILANIYLNELDILMENMCKKISKGSTLTRKVYAPYQELNVQRFVARKKGNQQLAKELLKKMRTMQSKDPFDQNFIRVKYTRYADDFVVMINGSKNLAETIREEIRDFLEKELKIELNREKTLITNLGDQRVKFLGYEIAKVKEDTAITEDKAGVKKRYANGTIQLLVPAEVIREKLKPFVANGKAVHHNARVNLPLLDLITQYNAEIRGLYNYYCLATDVSTKIGKFRFYHYTSLMKTIARKEQCSVAQVLEKYGVDVRRKQGTGTRKVVGVTYLTKEGTKTTTYFNDSIKKKDRPQIGAGANGVLLGMAEKRHRILDRMNAEQCELCGKHGTLEVHHIRKLKDIKEKYSKRGDTAPRWVLRMCQLRRKTLVVCQTCHDSIHSGQNTMSIKDAIKGRP